MAFYLLNEQHGARDMGPNRLVSGQAVGIQFAPGPFANPKGSFYFKGSKSSYVEFKQAAALDTKYSISILAWIYPEKDGPIFNYMRAGYGVHLWVTTPRHLFARYIGRNGYWPIPLVSSKLKKNEWNFVGTTYNGDTGEATLWIGNQTVVKLNLRRYELSTYSNIRMGGRIGDKRYFRGRIACLQVYAEALSGEQILRAKHRCRENGKMA